MCHDVVDNTHTRASCILDMKMMKVGCDMVVVVIYFHIFLGKIVVVGIQNFFSIYLVLLTFFSASK